MDTALSEKLERIEKLLLQQAQEKEKKGEKAKRAFEEVVVCMVGILKVALVIMGLALMAGVLYAFLDMLNV